VRFLKELSLGNEAEEVDLQLAFHHTVRLHKHAWIVDLI